MRRKLFAASRIRWLVGLGAIVAAALVGVWAGRTALAPPADPLESAAEVITYEVGVDTVGRVLTFPGRAEWPTRAGPTSNAVGTVTSIEIEPGDVVRSGDVLYRVDLRPVVVARGETPMFRGLDPGDEGPDVAQLQEMLADLGLFDGDADGRFGAETSVAVRAWQTDVGYPEDGSVDRGDLVFVPELPLRVTPGDAVESGRQLSGGEEAFHIVADAPRFWVPLGGEQRGLVSEDAAVRVEHADGTWDARVVEVLEDPDQPGRITYELQRGDGEPVCGDDCVAKVPLGGVTEFRVGFEEVPETSGPALPVAALRTGPTGDVVVTMEDGTERPVQVREGVGGIVIVEGVEPGERILVPGDGGT